MYQKPDFMKISVRIADVYASGMGQQTGCPQDEFGEWKYTIPCEGTDNYQQVTNTRTGMGLGHECYTSLNP